MQGCEIYLPSPPHAPLGVTTTSLHWSVCVLYTSSFSGFPSLVSTKEKKSSDCKRFNHKRMAHICVFVNL